MFKAKKVKTDEIVQVLNATCDEYGKTWFTSLSDLKKAVLEPNEKLVKITDEGIKKTDEIIEVIQSWEDKVTANITEEELKTLKQILFKIIMI